MPPPPPVESLRVTVIGDNAQTIEGLRRYLSSAGVESQATRILSEGTVNLPDVDAMVIFPDEFRTDEVVTSVETLQKERPQLRLLLVTSSPRSYLGTRLMDVELPPIILPKPAFGWSILDAIRESFSTEGIAP
jgi:hypothetical protein